MYWRVNAIWTCPEFLNFNFGVSKLFRQKTFNQSVEIWSKNSKPGSIHWVKSVQVRSFSSPYSVRIQENTDQKKLHIWTLFTQWCWRYAHMQTEVEQTKRKSLIPSTCHHSPAVKVYKFTLQPWSFLTFSTFWLLGLSSLANWGKFWKS